MNSKEKLTILLCPFSIYSSIYSFIGIAQNLQKCGYRIVFAINESFKGKVKSHGFEEILMSSNTSNQFKTESEEFQYLEDFYINNGIFDSKLTPFEKLKLWLAFFGNGNLRQSKHNDAKIKKIIDEIQPNLIIVDIIFTFPSVIKSGIPWVLCGCSNPIKLIDDIRTPPAQLGLPSNDSTEWTKYREEIHKIIKPIVEECNEWLIDEGLSPVPLNQLYYESKHLNIYQFSKELDYTDMRPLKKNWVQFDSFMRYKTGEFIIPEHLRDKPGKLILLSMGTLTSINVKMMKHLIEILGKTPHRYIVSKGIHSDKYQLCDNMWGEKMVPQINILPHVDMFITHGGNSGVCEAFYFGKPMIVMPFCNEQYDTAQRVQEKGFGLRMDPNLCSEEELTNGIEKILNDKELAKRMNEISKRIQNEEKCNKIALLIGSLLK